MSQSGSNGNPNGGGGGGGGIHTINGNTGFITGTTVTLTTGASNANGTSKFTGNNTTTMTMTFDEAVSSGSLGIGTGCLSSMTGTQQYNTIVGCNAAPLITSGVGNCGMGQGLFFALTTGDFNTGLNAQGNLLTGSGNTFLGYATGQALTSSESSNIYLGCNNFGQMGDNNVMRLGLFLNDNIGYISTTYIAGVAGVTTSNSQIVTINTTTGQLGSSATPTGVIGTINGDSGAITGSTVTIYADNAGLNSGSSVSFVNSGTTSTFNLTDSNSNTLLGKNSGNLTLSGNSNTGLGLNCLHGLSTGSGNCCAGWLSGTSITTGIQNTAFGFASLSSCTTTGGNTAIGSEALQVVIGTNNTSIGFESFRNLAGNASNNIGIGASAGSAYTTTESSNIVIGNAGVIAESHVIRLGTQGSSTGQQNECFVAGITGVTTSNSQMVTIDTTTGQLGAAAIPGGGGVAFVYSKVSGTNDVTGDGTVYQIVFDTVLHQTGSQFDGTLFTCDKAGYYLFACNAQPSDLSTQTVAYTAIITTSNTFVGGLVNPLSLSVAGQIGVGFSTIAYMNLGDTASFNLVVSGGSKTVDIGGNCFCSGALLF